MFCEEPLTLTVISLGKEYPVFVVCVANAWYTSKLLLVQMMPWSTTSAHKKLQKKLLEKTFS